MTNQQVAENEFEDKFHNFSSCLHTFALYHLQIETLLSFYDIDGLTMSEAQLGGASGFVAVRMSSGTRQLATARKQSPTISNGHP